MLIFAVTRQELWEWFCEDLKRDAHNTIFSYESWLRDELWQAWLKGLQYAVRYYT